MCSCSWGPISMSQGTQQCWQQAALSCGSSWLLRWQMQQGTAAQGSSHHTLLLCKAAAAAVAAARG
jgi:hypothetical protein